MANNKYLADRIRQQLVGEIGKMWVGILFDNKSEEAKVMVRVGKLNYEELLNRLGSKPKNFIDF